MCKCFSSHGYPFFVKGCPHELLSDEVRREVNPINCTKYGRVFRQDHHPAKRERGGGQFSCHGHRGLSLGHLSSSGSNTFAISAKLAIRSKRAKNVVGRSDEQPPQIGIAGLGDRKGLVGLPGLVPLRCQSQKYTDIPALGKSRGLFQGEHEV